jgi:hypothetical protein
MNNSISLSIISVWFLCSSLLILISCKKENQPVTQLVTQLPKMDSAFQLVSVGAFSEHLSRATILAGPVSVSQKVLFFRDKLVDIYDASSNNWSIALISDSFSNPSAIISAGNNLYATNGDRVWRLQL